MNGKPLAPPEPNQPAIFHLMINNAAGEASSYEFYLDAKSNKDDLRHVIDGVSTTQPISYSNLGPSNGVATVLTVFRGPTKYSYAPLVVGLRSKCEPDRKKEISLPVQFLQECSTVRFAANLKEMKTFVVNHTDSLNKVSPNSIRIVSWNPQAASRPWKDDNRLTNVVAEYRAHGSQAFDTCLSKEKKVLDFKPHENGNGYATLHWDVGEMADGLYDIRLRTTCTATGSEVENIYGRCYVRNYHWRGGPPSPPAVRSS